jgi:hypothetical protein
VDSSRTDGAVEDSYTPWQVSRLRTRLNHYRAAKSHGWERIATDILYVEDLPDSYVDTEDVRPLSESLRRLVNGSQTPSLHRLNAVKLFLIEQRYLGQKGLEETSQDIAASLAFMEFSTNGNKGSENEYQHLLASVLPGTYRRIVRLSDDTTELWYVIQIEHVKGHVQVRYLLSEYRNPSGRFDLQNNLSLRKRAFENEHIFEGWATATSNDQMVFFLKDKAYGKGLFSFILIATELPESATAISKLLMLDYGGSKILEDFEKAEPALDEAPPVSVKELFNKQAGKELHVFENTGSRP